MGRDQQRLGLADGTTGAVLGSATYARLTTVAVVTLPPRAAPGASPAESPQPEPTTSVPQAPQAATDAWMHFQSDTGDYIGGGKQQVWTLKESDFSVGGNNRDIRTSVSGQGDWWYLEFRAPNNGPAWRRPVHQCRKSAIRDRKGARH